MSRSCWMLGFALALLLGCKSTPPPQEAPAFLPFELLDAGDEPRALLRYAIEEGPTTSSDISLEAISDERAGKTTTMSGLKRLHIKAALGPAQRVGDEIRFEYEIVDSEAVAGSAATKRLIDDIEADPHFMTGVGASIVINDRGQTLGGQYNDKAEDIPLRLLWTITNVETFLSLVVLPEEPVGIGARWRIRGMLALYGIKMQQEASYTLVERSGDEIVLEIDFERVGERQTIEFAKADSAVEVQSSHETASGRIRLDLKHLGSNGRATGAIHNEVVVVEGDTRERQEIDERFEIRIRTTTTIPESASPAD